MHSRVRDVMTGNVVSVPETAGYKDIVTMMEWRGVSAFPVVNAAGRVVGVVSEADLLLKEVGPESFAGPGGSMLASGRRGERAKAAAVTAAELMSKPAVTIAPDASVTEAARLMYTRRVKRLPVVDDTGRLVGIVSRVDVLSVFTRPDDEIRGEVLGKVIGGEFRLDPGAFDVSVTSGIVTISGLAERRVVASELIGAVRYLEGVVDVRDRIACPPEEPPTLAGGILRSMRMAAGLPGTSGVASLARRVGPQDAVPAYPAGPWPCWVAGCASADTKLIRFSRPEERSDHLRRGPFASDH